MSRSAVISVSLVIGAIMFASAAVGEDLHFQRMTGSPFTVGSQPYVAIGDVNGDGKGDMVTRNLADNTFTVMLANDSGGFTEAANSPVDSGVTFQTLTVPVFGDMDGDGDLDMVSDCPDGVVVLLNDGSGEFSHAAGSPFSTGMQELYDRHPDYDERMWIPPSSTWGSVCSMVTDMNGDGYLDVIARTGQYFITILLGDGSGGFTIADGYPLDLSRGDLDWFSEKLDGVGIGDGYVPRAHNVGDFNGDGIRDYLIPRGMMTGNGAGGFVVGPRFVYPDTTNPSTGPSRLNVLDLNGDDADDFMWTQADGRFTPEGGDPHTMFLSDGAAGFSWEHGHHAKGLPTVADVNGDGKDDLVGIWGFFDGYPYGLYVFYGDGQGKFTEASGAPLCVWEWSNSFYRYLHRRSVAVDDVNGDGKPDIAVCLDFGGEYDKKVDVFINTKAGDFLPAIQRPVLAGGRPGRAFTYTITAKGTKPMTFTAGPLPAGLSLSGDTISGTPTVVGQTKVTMTATNNAGSDSEILTITITDGTNHAPSVTAGPVATPNPSVIQQSVAFSVTATDSDNDSLSYVWSFGDGTTGSGSSPTHVFAAAGTYQVVVTVTDGKGGSAWKGVAVLVREFADLGDLNGDKVVNVDDLSVVRRHFGEDSDSPNWDPRADANWDNVVNDADVLIVTENFGRVYE